MKRPIDILPVFLAALIMAGGVLCAHAAEITIWYDDEGVPHVTREAESPVPPDDRPSSPDVLAPQQPPPAKKTQTRRPRQNVRVPSMRSQPSPPPTAARQTDYDAAIDEGRKLAASPYIFNEGLGVYEPFTFQYEKRVTETVDGEPRTKYVNTQLVAYLFVGTRYNMVKARAAVSASLGRGVTGSYVEQVKRSDRVPVAFYAAGFEPGVMLLRQKGKYVLGEEGFGEPDPGIEKVMLVKNFPLDALDFSAMAQVEVYDRDGKRLMFEVDLSSYR